METLTLFLFCFVLILFIFLGFPIVVALFTGLVIFFIYGFYHHFSFAQMLQMCIDGIKEAGNIIITMLIIGILTAMWRASGTISMIIVYAGYFIKPSIFLFMSFLLNCIVSFLLGTSFGTAATMGVICATMASTMDIPFALAGGAVLSGVFFGDRCSPLSTSAILVSEVTHTDLYVNIKNMFKTAIVPFVVTSLLFLVIGFVTPHKSINMDLRVIFGKEFNLAWFLLIPAVLILVLSAFRVKVKRAMIASIFSAIPICLFFQHIGIVELCKIALFGFKASNGEVGKMLNGGGLLSMINVVFVLCISSSYSGFFQKTQLLSKLKAGIKRLSEKITNFGALVATSFLASAIACNQTLAIILTNQLCKDLEKDNSKMAINLENSVVMIAGLIPWSIAGAVPLASIGAPLSSLFFGFYLYLIPLWRLILELFNKNKKNNLE